MATIKATLALALERWWWQRPRHMVVQLLRPLSWIYRLMWALRRLWHGLFGPAPVGVPVVVVGNLVVGGAGKTPTVVALVRALRKAGRHPGVVSRGWGRELDAPQDVRRDADPNAVGDEPLLIHRVTGAPVFVGKRRGDAARALLIAHPQVDVIVSDDGLQHLALTRQAQVLVFDGRGAGNGLLLPAGPLREPLPKAVPPHTWVLYNGRTSSTALPGCLARRALTTAVPLNDWLQGTRQRAVPIAGLRGPPLLATAGIAEPERFFAMLEAAGLTIRRLPLPDHFAFTTLPWPRETPEVVLTEKDAVKLGGHTLGDTRVWVVPLDFSVPEELLSPLIARLFATP